MKLNRLSLIVAGALALGGMQSAMACSFAAWGQGAPAGGGTVGAPTTVDKSAGGAAYAGRCAARAVAAAAYNQDGLPTAETGYKVRFAMYTGFATGSAKFFAALDGAAAQKIGATYVAGSPTGSFDFQINTGTAVSVTGVRPASWYSIEINWTQNAAATVTVVGGNSNTYLTGGNPLAVPPLPVTPLSIGTAGAADTIDTAQFGNISGDGAGGTGFVAYDAFESRRTSLPGHLPRADATGDGVLSGADVVAVRRDIVGTAFALGQSDCTEDGGLSGADVVCTRRQILGTNP